MTAYQQGYEDALAGKPVNKWAMKASGRDAYRLGYQQGTRERGQEVAMSHRPARPPSLTPVKAILPKFRRD